MDQSSLPNHQRIRVSDAPIEPSQLLDEVTHTRSGAIALFLGTVRDHSGSNVGVTHLEYEVYEGQIEASIAVLVDEAGAKWPLNAVVVEHRVGRVELSEATVAVAVSSAHRADAFAAAQYLIDQLKSRAPIWKKEFWPGGEEWSRS